MTDEGTHALPPLLLVDVLAHPDVDDYRRIAADWFDDRGDPASADYASFIRTQLELATVPSCQVEGKVVNWQSPMRACRAVFPEPHDGTGWGPHCGPCRLFVRLRSRSRELLDGVCGLGVEMLPVVEGLTRSNAVGRGLGYGWYLRDSKDGQGIEATFRRGFVEAVSLPLQLWLDHGVSLVSAAPLATVTLTDREPYGANNRSTGWRAWFPRREYPLSPLFDENVIPDELFDLLEGEDESPVLVSDSEISRHPSPEAAHKALSVAALAWAQSQANRCPACKGSGNMEPSGTAVGGQWVAFECRSCGGTGRRISIS